MDIDKLLKFDSKVVGKKELIEYLTIEHDLPDSIQDVFMKKLHKKGFHIIGIDNGIMIICKTDKSTYRLIEVSYAQFGVLSALKEKHIKGDFINE